MSASSRLQREQRRAALRAGQRKLRQRLQAQMAAQVEAQRNNPLFVAALERRRKRRRRRQLVAAILAALLLLLLARCECDEPPAEPAVLEEAEPAPAPKPPPPAPKPKRKRPLEGTLEPSERDSLAVEATAPPPWLPQFRLQVAARSPRLATCFNGADRPGALRWTALVHARSGRVSESVIEPVFRGVQLEQSQHDCLVEGLADPPFQLDAPADETTARRVSLIFEF